MDKNELYTELDSTYDTLAKYVATTSRQIDKTRDKAEEIDKEFQINLNRLSLYIRNEFWDKYSYKRHTFLVTKDNSFKFYSQKKLKIATAKYEAMQEDEDDNFDKEFSLYFDDEFFDFEAEEEILKKQFEDKITFLEKELGKPLFETKINPKQEKTINKIVTYNKELEKKSNFAHDKVAGLEQEYNDCLQEIVSTLIDDEKYDFDIETDEIMTVRDPKTMIWHLIYFNADEVDVEEDEENM